MNRLSLRLATAGARAPLVLSILGVALGTLMLVTVASLPVALERHEERVGWRDPETWISDPAATTAMVTGESRFRDEPLFTLEIEQQAEATVIVPGMSGPVLPGEVWLSPRLGELVAAAPANELGDRFPGRIAGTIETSSLSHPDDLVAYVGTTAPDGAVAVAELPPTPFDPEVALGFKILVGVGLVAVLVPMAVFIGAAVRLSAARRERRLAVVRLAGATRSEVRRLAVAETMVITVLGTAAGVPLYLLAVPAVAALSTSRGLPFLPADLAPVPVAVLVIAAGIICAGVVASLAATRRLEVSPLGVAARQRRTAPHPWRLLVLGVGAAGFAVITLAEPEAIWAVVVLVVCLALVLIGLATSGAVLTMAIGRALVRFGRGATALLAGRRLAADPKAGFRAITGAVLALFSAAFLLTLLDHTWFEPESGIRPGGIVVRVEAGSAAPATVAALAAVDGVEEVAVAEALEDKDMWRGDCAAVAAVLEVDCAALPVVADGDEVPVYVPEVFESGPVSVVNRVLLASDGGRETLDRVRTVAATAGPEVTVTSLRDHHLEYSAGSSLVATLIDGALFVTLLVAGASLGVTVAGSLLERRLPFALLRMGGVRLAELRRVVMLEALLPLTLAGAVSAALGLVAAWLLSSTFGVPLHLPPLSLWVRLGVGFAAAVAVSLAALPLLGRLTTTEQTRFT